MHFDFAALMVLATAITGAIWALDVWLWAPKRQEKAMSLADREPGLSPKKLTEAQDNITKEPIVVEYSRSLFPVILIVLILRSFMVEPFRIPSGSMIPTLLVGDFILVNKYAYGIRLPVINTKVIDIGEPQRGDVAVFRYPNDPSTDYIKRVIGIPGDRISYYNKQLVINGKPVELKDKGAYRPDPGQMNAIADLKLEKIDNVEHEIIVDGGRPTINNEYVVPEGEYFVMGDNRDNSNDSRYWGTVPEENLVGRAFFIWMNMNSFDRIGTSIK